MIAEAVPLPAAVEQLSRLAPRHQLEHLAQPVPGVVVGVGGEVDVEQPVAVVVRRRDRGHEVRQGGDRQGPGAVGETTLLVGEEEAALEGSADENVWIAVVVKIGEDGAGAEVLEVETRLPGNVPEGPVSLVVEKQILSQDGIDVDVVVPVPVDVDDRNPRFLVEGGDVEQDVRFLEPVGAGDKVAAPGDDELLLDRLARPLAVRVLRQGPVEDVRKQGISGLAGGQALQVPALDPPVLPDRLGSRRRLRRVLPGCPAGGELRRDREQRAAPGAGGAGEGDVGLPLPAPRVEEVPPLEMEPGVLEVLDLVEQGSPEAQRG